MALNLAEKKDVVAEITKAASKAVSAVVADYRGMTVNQMTQLRINARKKGIYVRVTPNTLMKRAFSGSEFSCLDDHLVGPSFIAFSYDSPGDAARLCKEGEKTFESLKVKALAVSGKAYGREHLEAIASLPSREEALSKLLFVMKAPVEKMVRTFAAPQLKLVRTLVAIKDQKAG